MFDFMNMEDAQREQLLAPLTQAQLRVSIYYETSSRRSYALLARKHAFPFADSLFRRLPRRATGTL